MRRADGKILFVFSALIIIIIGLVLEPAFSFSSNNTHPSLTQEVAALFNRKSKVTLSDEEINWLRQGATEEDEPMRYNNHFYNPVTGGGWSGKYFGSLSQTDGFKKGADSAPRLPISSVDWATNQSIQAAYGRQYGNQTWQKAIKAYIDGDKKSAYIALGHVLHLVEDMAVPDHTRDDTHAGIFGDPGSPFEDFAKNYTNFNKLTIAQNLASQNKSIPNYQTLQDAFIGLASYSNKNFFSEDTISNEEFSEPNVKNLVVVSKQIDSTTIRKYLFSNNIYLSWITNEDPLTGKRNYSTKEQSFVLPSYRDHLFPQAVLAGAGVMELFFKEVEKYRKNPEALGEIVPDQSEPLLSAVQHSFTLAVANTYDALDRVVVGTQVAFAKSKSLVQGLIQKVKLATATPKPSPIKGQVLGEQVEASNITVPTTPPLVVPIATSMTDPNLRQAIANRVAIVKAAVNKAKEAEEKSATAIIAKEDIKSDNPNSSNEIATRPAAARNDKKEGELQDDSSALDGPVDLADKNNNIELSNPHPTLSLDLSAEALAKAEGRGNNKLALTRPGASFIGIHAPSNPHPTLSLEGRGDNNSPAPPQDDPPAPDTIPPTTQITLLPATTTIASFLVQWNGTDNIQITPASYDIQYQPLTLTLSPEGRGDNLFSPSFDINGWLDWELATSSTSSIFIGQDEKTYGFRSRGRDAEANQSVYPSSAETYTYLNLSAPNPPTITSHTNNQTITDSDDIASTTTGVQINLSGTADPQDIITITLSETLAISTTTASSTGAWTAMLTLAEGANTITLQAQEADWDISSSATIILNLTITPLREVVINEIAWMGTSASTADEWIELYNPGNTAIDLTGWKLFGDEGNTLMLNLTGQIASQGYYLIERTDDNTVSNIQADIFGPFSGNGLSNSGELLTLRKSDGVLVDRAGSSTVAWFSGNNSSAANRASMERKNPTADGESAGNWASNDTLFVSGQDANNANLNATPKSQNSVNTTIPRPTTDLTIQNIYTTHNTVKLYWTAPKNANLNIADQTAYYDLRYTTGAGCTINDSNFATATTVSDEPTPSETVGTSQSLSITGLNSSTVYCFALKTYNGANTSSISNIASTTTHALPSENPLTSLGFLNNIFPNNYTITLANSPYSMDGVFYINAGNTVTIEPGVVIKMTSGTQWQISGQLVINGTSFNPVVLTSVKDDTYAGDTNNDGNATSPNNGNWYRFALAAANARITMASTIMRYGGSSGSPMIEVWPGTSAIINDSILEYSLNNAIAMVGETASATITNSILRNNVFEGIGISTRANATIQGSTFTNNRRGIAIDTNADTANLIISGNNFYANNASPSATPNAGIHFSDADDTLTATNNWWGSVDGPTTISPDSDATRDAAVGRITFTSWAISAFSILPSGF